jgi:hypothetical protein
MDEYPVNLDACCHGSAEGAIEHDLVDDAARRQKKASIVYGLGDEVRRPGK